MSGKGCTIQAAHLGDWRKTRQTGRLNVLTELTVYCCQRRKIVRPHGQTRPTSLKSLDMIKDLSSTHSWSRLAVFCF